jgi:hypothetical protein
MKCRGIFAWDLFAASSSSLSRETQGNLDDTLQTVLYYNLIFLIEREEIISQGRYSR